MPHVACHAVTLSRRHAVSGSSLSLRLPSPSVRREMGLCPAACLSNIHSHARIHTHTHTHTHTHAHLSARLSSAHLSLLCVCECVCVCVCVCVCMCVRE